MFKSGSIVQLILRRGNGPGLIAEWFAGMKQWAEANGGQDAAALKVWLDIVQPRPFYTAEELARFWPALRLTLGMTKRLEPGPSPNRLENELTFYRLPEILFDTNEIPFRHKFFIVEHCHRWRKHRFSVEEVQTILSGGEI